MHPYWHWHRGPSRLWWFVIGAVTATWWHKSKEYHGYKLEQCSRHRIPSEAYPGPPTTPTPGPRSNLQAVPLQEKAPAMPPTMQPNPASSWGWGSNSSWSQSPLPTSPPIDRWEESRVRTEELTNKASEKFMEMSEATIDSVLGTVESLKAKLAEHRAQREQQTKEIQAMREEQIRQVEEWKKTQPPRHVV